jgi:hypothetical protein
VSGQRRVRSWQKADPHLRRHPSFLKFARLLDVNPNLANGILSGVWAFAFDFAPDGDLSRFDPDDLALSLDWEMDGALVWRAMRDAGFLESGGIIADWESWGGAVFSDRKREAERKWDQRNLSEQENVSTGHTGTMPMSQGQVGTKPREEKRREEKRERTSAAKIAAPTAEQWEEREQTVLSTTQFPTHYRELAGVMAAENASGKVARSRVVGTLYEPLLAVENNGVGLEAFEYGLRAALAKGAANVNYVKKAAHGYQPTLTPMGKPSPPKKPMCPDCEVDMGYDEEGHMHCPVCSKVVA